MDTTGSLIRLQYLLNLLGTPAGVFGAAILALLFVLSFLHVGRWIALSTMMTIATFSFTGASRTVTLISPFREIGSNAEALVIAMLVILFLPSILSRTTGVRRPLLAAAFCFWILQIVFALRVAVAVDINRGVLGGIVHTALLIIFCYGMPRWLRSVDDLRLPLRCMGVSAFCFVAATSIQLVANRSAIIRGDRLYAVTANPQHAGFILAIMLVPVFMLVSSTRESYSMRVIWGALCGLIVVMIIWTGLAHGRVDRDGRSRRLFQDSFGTGDRCWTCGRDLCVDVPGDSGRQHPLIRENVIHFGYPQRTMANFNQSIREQPDHRLYHRE